MFIGIFILALGILFLLRNTGVIYGDFWRIVWPLVLVAFGISLIFDRKKKRS
jgi:hypothetical protein